MKSFCLCYFMQSGSQSLATLIPDFLSQEPISRSEQLSSALAIASILFLDGFSANFENKISLTSPSVETGDRKVFSDVLTGCFFRRKKCCTSQVQKLHASGYDLPLELNSQFQMPRIPHPIRKHFSDSGLHKPDQRNFSRISESRVILHVWGDKVKRSNYYLPTRYSTVRATQHKILKSMSQWNKFLGISFCHNHNQLLSSPEVFLK